MIFETLPDDSQYAYRPTLWVAALFIGLFGLSTREYMHIQGLEQLFLGIFAHSTSCRPGHLLQGLVDVPNRGSCWLWRNPRLGGSSMVLKELGF
jgi:hypothetical protein